MQELPDDVLQQAHRIFVDTSSAFYESKDMIEAKKFGWNEQNVPTLKELVHFGEKAYKRDELTIFKSVGHGIFDIVTAIALFEKIS